MNASDSLRAVAAFGSGLALGVCLALAIQARADDPPPADAAGKCERLAGLERSECERRLAVAQEQQEKSEPKKKTASEREKEEKARAEEEAAHASSAADPDTKPREPKSAANESESDTLDPPRD